MNEENTMTISELLRVTVDQLNDIRVPVKLANEIARPLAQAVSQIQACIDALEQGDEADKAESEATADV